MRQFLLAAGLALAGSTALADSIDPSTTEFPWMNGPSRDARYSLSSEANRNKVHVFEAYGISCSWCNRNAPQVDALATEYVSNLRVQVIDLGLDSSDRDYARWIQMHNPNHPVVKDEGRVVWQALMQENGIPQTFVVACDGQMTGFTIGYWGDEEKETLRNAISRALETTCN